MPRCPCRPSSWSLPTPASAPPAAKTREPRNLRALLVYGMSGGKPATIEAAAAASAGCRQPAVVDGSVLYWRRSTGAMAALRDVDPMNLRPTRAFVALVKGSCSARRTRAAIALFDRASF